ncbi:M10 family metallopeptidase C-terminal domain-containing protein [Sphingomicrobium sediminis]|uniref:M10 family metallopeptidase C-terminal domain-containing protein n=1 Tax=Sphingomicrobium sediminis TaxID=2950949 RepID=A0A9X2J2J6_9SPHN|nr:M10 family metallopeptidase C-terminal domain-containing protein [Sphingomicrobium sediminis]MCM8557844.1 M10 family metallopeptidase C-terminal domain-containing protein [Sphingomicrobium sediminis]
MATKKSYTKTSDDHVHNHNEHGVCACGHRFEDRPDRFENVSDEPQEFNLDPFAGFTFRDKPILDQQGIIDQIDSGTRMPGADDGVITYSFNANTAAGWLQSGHFPGRFKTEDGDFFNISGGTDMSSLSAAQQDAARIAFQMWDDLIPQQFVEVNGRGSGVADIIVANSADPAQAFAYFPGEIQGWWDGYRGDVFITDPALNWTNAWFTDGGYGNTVFVHEFGHSLGLSHPGAYNGAGATNYEDQAEYAQDSTQYSIMSYWSPGETGARVIAWDSFTNHNAQGPMLHDILTIQSIYGADPDTRATDTVYGFNTNTDLWVFDFEQNPYPFISLYDAGGEDTIDMSGFTSLGNFLDLHAGSFSSIGDGFASEELVNTTRAEISELIGFDIGGYSQGSINAIMSNFMVANANSIQADTGVSGVFASNYSNFSIAYGTTIENAIGSSGRDVIWGNEVSNMIDGGAGDDVIDGYEGADIINGGSGADVLTGGEGADTFDFDHIEIGDIITDFDASEGDMIDLSGIGEAAGVDLTFVGDADFTGTAGEVNYQNGVLSADVDGDGVADFQVTLEGMPEFDMAQIMLDAGGGGI